ncbi:hypothetical protein C5B78_00925 [Aeromonas salmonicida]|uniref:hypothetical protein n=1 Tax=Aeromonas salmonicida TaxID=645 RepID=UPI000F76B052|nr:hypothetical protein [Aeromonas salmonicida]RSM32277.1 hypothetical protein C5B78_00925 [Aeromonas salmonicida]
MTFDDYADLIRLRSIIGIQELTPISDGVAAIMRSYEHLFAQLRNEVLSGDKTADTAIRNVTDVMDVIIETEFNKLPEYTQFEYMMRLG